MRTAVVILIVWKARGAITWVLISLFLALALNPAVEALQRRGLSRRGAAVATIYVATILFLIGVTALLVPPLAHQVRDLAHAAPGYVNRSSPASSV
jgi:predicted PurR-regulated permease PerM